MTFVNVGLGSWVTSYLDDRGSISSTQARWLPALIGLGLLPAALVGALAARGGRERRVVGASALGLAAVAVLLGVAASPVLIGVLLFALGWFSALPFGVILASVVGAGGAARAETQGVLTGAVNGLGFVAGSAAPPLAGAVKDASGSYVVAFSVLAVGAVVSLAATRGAFPSNRVAAAVPQHG
jgi:CP family cyanate transporter-like MFS transporter